MKILKNRFREIISEENLWRAWMIYRRGKRNRPAVREFERNLEDNLSELRRELLSGTYKHGKYFKFIVFDPKRRTISVPTVRDHLVHQAVYNVLYPFFDKCFSPFSFSCRLGKGTHKAVMLLEKYMRQMSQNWRSVCWVLHGDISKCFDSIDHDILIKLLRERINCDKTMNLFKIIIRSYCADGSIRRGIPLGNLTSQLFVNVYLDGLDRFCKEKLGIKKYARYADDFVILAESIDQCLAIAETIRVWVKEHLALDFPLSHQRVANILSGIEVLGRKFLTGYCKCKTKTRLRSQALFSVRCEQYRQNEIGARTLDASWQSLKGMLKHGNNFGCAKSLLETTQNLSL